MQTDDKTGIICDFCNGQHKIDFTYYSLDLNIITVRSNIQRVTSQAVIKSFDLCQLCWEEMSNVVKQNYRAVYHGICCDLTGKYLSGDYDCYLGKVSSITINLSSGSRIAEINSQVAALIFSADAYEQLLAKVSEMRKVSTKWSTSNTGQLPKNK